MDSRPLDRLEFLASVFAIDCLTYAILSNHLHLVPHAVPIWFVRGPMKKSPGGG